MSRLSSPVEELRRSTSKASDQGTAHDASLAPAYTSAFFDRGAAAAESRKMYIKVIFGGIVMIAVIIFGIFSIYWGALWKIPAHPLKGWVIDFDGDRIGSTVSNALVQSSAGGSKINWIPRYASEFRNGDSDIADAILNEKAWIAVIINREATSTLQHAIASADASYNGSSALTAYGVEARSENAYRTILNPVLQSTMQQIAAQFSRQTAAQVANSTNISEILRNAPQLITQPVSYTLVNIRPFDVPVASAVTFVGCIYQVILAFFVVMIAGGAREASGLERKLTTMSLIHVRMTTSFVAYFILSLLYSLLSLAFQVPFDRRYGHAGFVIFWMVNYVGMLALGLALEAMITLLTVRFIPFFLLLWIISNISVAFMPIEVLPAVFRYGYGFPVYNISHAIRSIIFGSKNTLGLNFGIIIAWAAVSCVTLPLFQWIARRGVVAVTRPVEIIDEEGKQ
ncbi:hypothetical protein GGG16DRAFT_55197 [Schizophyllum commune]